MLHPQWMGDLSLKDAVVAAFPWNGEDLGVVVEAQDQDVDGDYLVKQPFAALLIVVDTKVAAHIVAAVQLSNGGCHQLLQRRLRIVVVVAAAAGYIAVDVLLLP